MSLQTMLGRWKAIRGVVAAAAVVLVGYYALFGVIERFNTPPDPSQWKCEPRKGMRIPESVPRPEGGVKVINLTNAGEFTYRCEATEVWYDLICDLPEGRYGPLCRDEAKGRPKLTLLYIHGWKHSSDEKDSDREAFTKLVANLDKLYEGRKNVLGIYVGWNASAPLLLGPVENLSFWSKMAIADRIAQAGAVTKIVTATGALSNSTRGKGDQFIAIGHSFGARLLFSAVGQSLIYEAAQSHPGYAGGTFRVMRGPTDAMILLNPAFEASRYTSLDTLRRIREETFNANQPPLLVSIASTGDQATRLAFPLGQWLDLRRGERETTTLGNYAPFVTHTLLPTSSGQCEAGTGGSIANAFVASNFCLQRSKTSGRNPDNNPFIIAETSPEVIADHNDIWNEPFSNWLTAFIAALERRIDAASPDREEPVGQPKLGTAATTPDLNAASGTSPKSTEPP